MKSLKKEQALIKQFVLEDNISNTNIKINKNITQKNTNNTKERTQDNTLCYKEDKYNLSNDEIMFIKKLYQQHKVTQKITQDTNTEENLIARSIRIDKNIINTFAKYCKNNNIKQSTALRIALENFMKK